MKRKVVKIAVSLIFVFLFLAGCSMLKKNPVSTEKTDSTERILPSSFGHQVLPESTGTVEPEKNPQLPALNRVDWNSAKEYTGDWTSYVWSELAYSLNRNRTGFSTVSWKGYAMSDWAYTSSDQWAYTQVSEYMGGSVGTTGMIRLQYTNPPWSWIERGGWCKFFANLILFRSSYGIGGGYHLVLPSGYSYATEDVRNARKGWVIQNPSIPHTAMVAENLGWGLDLIDANWVGGNGNYYIARHSMSWSQLAGFKAYKPTRMVRFY